jgi:predicted metalloprotease with PDZ domain
MNKTESIPGEQTTLQGDNQSAADYLFYNLADVLRYLQHQGFKLSRPSLYRHNKEGKIIPDATGKYSQKVVDRYAMTFLKMAATGRRKHDGSRFLQSEKMELEIKTLEEDLALKRLKRMAEEGQTCLVADVKNAAFTAGRHVRDTILSIPARISAILAAETDERNVSEIINVELLHALEKLSDITTFKHSQEE